MNIKLVKLSPEYKQHLFDMMEEWLAVSWSWRWKRTVLWSNAIGLL